jgi:serine/threonine protein kinase
MSYARKKKKKAFVYAGVGGVNEVIGRLGAYQVMEGIGRGACGTVYKGMAVKSGQTVALKSVSLQGVSRPDLVSIEMEIKLLQQLKHPNIVEYIDTIRTPDYLHIVLEYVENGSLSALLKKFGGHFPEALVSHYVSQILCGLEYLHDQGVIHRDIKGANILATKEGTVKLADFGVATKLNESRKSQSVVGTPYWMAPEIIELTGQQSSACDIWSVGCTCIELLTGTPPYFHLQQMSALFRIVQDEHPPLPDDISPGLADFLLLCFQKDPNRRIDATALMKHSWLAEMAEDADDDDASVSVPPVTPINASPSFVPAASSSVSPSTSSAAQSETHTRDEVSAGTERVADGDNDDDEHVVDVNANDGIAHRDGGEVVDSNCNRVRHGGGGSQTSAAPLFDMMAKSDTVRVQRHLDRFRERIGVDVDASDGTSLLANDGTSADDYTQCFIYKHHGDEIDISRFLARRRFELDDEKDDDVKPSDGGGGISGDASATSGALTKRGSGGRVADPFADMTFADDPQVDEDSQTTRRFLALIAQLTPRSHEDVIVDACEQLTEMVLQQPTVIRPLMALHGVVPVMEMLEVDNELIVHSMLNVVNRIIGMDVLFQQSMSLVGLIPAIIKFAGASYSTIVRLEAANFVRHFCYVSDFTRRMFIACGGLPVLVEFLHEAYEFNQTLVWNAVDCVRHVFDITTNPRNDFYRLFCKYGLLPSLARQLYDVNCDDASPEAADYVRKIAHIMLLFSQGDHVVRRHFAAPAVLEEVVKVLPHLRHDSLVLVLKAIRNLVIDESTLDELEDAGAIPALICMLDASSDTHADVHNQVLPLFYYLLQLQPSRQEQAVLSGIIPHLQRFVVTAHPLKQFALPIMFQLAKTSRRVRLELRKYRGVQFYIALLQERYWRTHALEVLAFWLNDAPQRVEFVLCTDANLLKLFAVFRTTQQAVQFETMLPLFQKLVAGSRRVNEAFGRSPRFMRELKRRLRSSPTNNIRINLLKLLTLLFDGHADSVTLVTQMRAVSILTTLSHDTNSVIVMSLAANLLNKFAAARRNGLVATAAAASTTATPSSATSTSVITSSKAVAIK